MITISTEPSTEGEQLYIDSFIRTKNTVFSVLE
jgi:hypothetical protein